jgi:phosphoglycerate dehydrogenase-like enzyme
MTSKRLIFNIDDDQPADMKEVMLALVPEGFDLRFNSGDRAEMMAELARADYLLVERCRVTDEILRGAPNLKLLQKCGRGVEIIDVAATQRLGIPLCCTSDANSDGTAELAVALMLAASRRLCFVHENLRQGKWIKFEMRRDAHELTGRTVGILGAGNVGRRVARIVSRGFNCRVLYNSRRRMPPEVEQDLGTIYCSQEDLLRQSDVVSVHLALTPETRHLIDAERLALMKPTAILVNTSRGLVVDEKALVEALKDGVIAAAGIDVFEKEPPDADNPLLKLPNVALSAHCGMGTVETISRVYGHAFGNIVKRENGEPLPEEDVIQL